MEHIREFLGDRVVKAILAARKRTKKPELIADLYEGKFRVLDGEAIIIDTLETERELIKHLGAMK